MSDTVRKFKFEEGGWKAVRVPKGHRKAEWNNPNHKIDRKIRGRQADYENLVKNLKSGQAGYHRPGSAS